MISLLNDLVSHTHRLGFLNIIKITGDTHATTIESMADDRTVILQGKTHSPIPEMVGTFGMTQLQKLKTHLDCPEYKRDAKVEIVSAERNGVSIPVVIHFENADGSFKNDYQFMNTVAINERLKSVQMANVGWDVTLSPSVIGVQRFSMQSTANKEHNTFVASLQNGDLKFTFGDKSTHGGEFVFATTAAGRLTKAWAWPVEQLLSILKMADLDSTVMRISNAGVMQITLDSGIATYNYLVLAQT